MDKDIDRWLDRLQTAMDVQKYEQEEFVQMRMSRADLISLSVLLNSLKDFKSLNGNEQNENKAIEEAKAFLEYLLTVPTGTRVAAYRTRIKEILNKLEGNE